MYKDILLAIDLGHGSSWRRALPTALEYCRAFGSRLHVMTVVPDFRMSLVGSFFPADYEQKAMAEAQARIHDFVDGEVPKEITTQVIVAHGTVYEEILRVAAETGVDLIVIASHRPELQDYLLGPNAARVVRHAGCSVLVVRG